MTGELWNTGDVLEKYKLNKICNVAIQAEVDDGSTVTPSTLGDAVFCWDTGIVYISADGENWTHKIPMYVLTTPDASTNSGVPGQFNVDALGNYLYVCIGVDQWKRVALTTF